MKNKVSNDGRGDESTGGENVWDGVYIFMGCELGKNLEEWFPLRSWRRSGKGLVSREFMLTKYISRDT